MGIVKDRLIVFRPRAVVKPNFKPKISWLRSAKNRTNLYTGINNYFRVNCRNRTGTVQEAVRPVRTRVTPDARVRCLTAD